MKKIEFVIRPEKVGIIKTILSECGAHGAMFSSISGYGNEKSQQYVFRGKPYYEQIFLKTKVETMVSDDLVDPLVERVLKEMPTGEIGDGKIFIIPLEDAVRIRTGERGDVAL